MANKIIIPEGYEMRLESNENGAYIFTCDRICSGPCGELFRSDFRNVKGRLLPQPQCPKCRSRFGKGKKP